MPLSVLMDSVGLGSTSKHSSSMAAKLYGSLLNIPALCHCLLSLLQSILRRKEAAASDSAEVLPGGWVVDRVLIGPAAAAASAGRAAGQCADSAAAAVRSTRVKFCLPQ